jgi:hypothetical protein
VDYTHWLIIGAGVAGLAFLLVAVFVFTRTQGKSKAMEGARTVSAAQAGKAAGPAGTSVELKGTAETDAPLVAPASGTPCVYYRHKVEELYVYYDYDQQYGRTQREDWRTISDDSTALPLFNRYEDPLNS